MKRLAVFILLGPTLFVLCVWFFFLPFASFMEGGPVKFNIEVDSFAAFFLGLMTGGFFLAVADWVADMLALRPWFAGAVGWALGALMIRGWFDLSQQRSWWFVVMGLLVAVPALVCSWLVLRGERKRAASV